MPIISCPSCGAQLQVPEGSEGRQAKCSQCPAVFPIPMTTQVSPQPVPMPSPQPAPPPQGEYTPQFHNELDFGQVPLRGHRKKSPVLLILFISGGVLLAIVAVIVVIFLLLPRSGPDQDLKFMPEEAREIRYYRVAELVKSKIYQDFVDDEADDKERLEKTMEETLGVEWRDVTTITVGRSRFDSVMVVHTNTSYRAQDILDNRTDDEEDYSEEKEGDYEYYVSKRDSAFCILDRQRILFASKKMMEDILDRNERPEFSEDLETALSEGNFSGTVSIVVAGDKSSAFFGGSIIYLNRQITFGDDAWMSMSLRFEDYEDAADYREKAEELKDSNQSGFFWGGGLRDLTISQSGNTVTSQGKIRSSDENENVDSVLNEIRSRINSIVLYPRN